MENRYEIAKEEYELEDENGKSRLVYAYFGLAIYYAQCLEQTLSIMLYVNRIDKKESITNAEVNEIIERIDKSKKTMGVFVNEVKQSYNLTAVISSQLYNVLKKRNYLIHKYFKENIAKCYSKSGSLDMIKFFCDFIDKSKEVDGYLVSYYQQYLIRFGVTEEKVSEAMKEMVEQMPNIYN